MSAEQAPTLNEFCEKLKQLSPRLSVIDELKIAEASIKAKLRELPGYPTAEELTHLVSELSDRYVERLDAPSSIATVKNELEDIYRIMLVEHDKACKDTKTTYTKGNHKEVREKHAYQ